MFGTVILLVFLVTATVTDIRWRKVLNWTTYPGILLALAMSVLATWLGIDAVQGGEREQELWGIVPIGDCLTGFFACSAAMLICYVFFPGGVGGGDVKLVAMIGAFLGLYAGLEAMLWTFVFGGCQALITLIWRVGAIELVRRASSQFWFAFRAGGHIAAADDEAKAKSPSANLFLSPSALVAVLIVRFHVVEWLRIS